MTHLYLDLCSAWATSQPTEQLLEPVVARASPLPLAHPQRLWQISDTRAQELLALTNDLGSLPIPSAPSVR